MVERILQVWDWRLAVIGTGTSAFLTSMQMYLGLIAVLLSIFSATATIILTTTKIFDWFDKKKAKKNILDSNESENEK